MYVLQEKVGPNDPKFLPLGLFGTRGVSKKFELIWLLEKTSNRARAHERID